MSLTDSCCVVWNRQLLDCLLAKDPFISVIMTHLIGRDVTKDPFISAIMTHLIGRDVTNKLYASLHVNYLLTYLLT